MLYFLFFALCALAAPWKEQWQAAVPGQPRAAYFLVASGEILVASEHEGVSSLLRYATDGQLLGVFVREEGKAGPIRSYGDRIYWAVAGRIYSYAADGSGRREESVPGEVNDIAFDSKGKMFVAGPKGVTHDGKSIATGATEGLFNLAGELFLLSGGLVRSLSGAGKPEKCADCRGLERGSDGRWISAQGRRVLRIGRNSDEMAKENSSLGRFAYVYRKDTKEDLLVIPLPDEKKLKAYRGH